MRKKYNSRKESNASNNFDDLLVFGYSSKLFRDDDMATEIDCGKRLIPWKGEEALLVDRYDGRHHLFDLNDFIFNNEKNGNNEVSETFNDEEEIFKEELENERYGDMYWDENLAIQEEEMKREKQSNVLYGAVSFVYKEKNLDDSNEQETDTSADSSELSTDKQNDPYVPSENVNFPDGMELPLTMKQHQIIEKTASFLSKESGQMEIVLKLKQKNNPVFDFLNFDHNLSPYYKYLLNLIKRGSYPIPKSETEQLSNLPQDSVISKSKTLPPGQIKNTLYEVLVRNLTSISENKISSKIDSGDAESCSSNFNNSVTSQSSSLTPPQKIKNFIDTVASYVVKNGTNFEILIKSKDDANFGFTKPGHQWYNYYMLTKSGCENTLKISENETKKPNEIMHVEKESRQVTKNFGFAVKIIRTQFVAKNILSDDEDEKFVTITTKLKPPNPILINREITDKCNSLHTSSSLLKVPEAASKPFSPEQDKCQASAVSKLTVHKPNSLISEIMSSRGVNDKNKKMTDTSTSCEEKRIYRSSARSIKKSRHSRSSSFSASRSRSPIRSISRFNYNARKNNFSCGRNGSGSRSPLRSNARAKLNCKSRSRKRSISRSRSTSRSIRRKRKRSNSKRHRRLNKKKSERRKHRRSRYHSSSSERSNESR